MICPFSPNLGFLHVGVFVGRVELKGFFVPTRWVDSTLFLIYKKQLLTDIVQRNNVQRIQTPKGSEKENIQDLKAISNQSE